MRNMAGREDCDTYILEELDLAGIRAKKIDVEHRHEVPYTWTGLLSAPDSSEKFVGHGKLLREFTFTRAWYYWVVEGAVPYDIALEFHKEDNDNIRVAGDCGCPHPEERSTRLTMDGRLVIDYFEVVDFMLRHPKIWYDTARFEWQPTHKDEMRLYDQYVTSYHIDTQTGLNLFAEKIKAYLYQK